MSQYPTLFSSYQEAIIALSILFHSCDNIISLNSLAIIGLTVLELASVMFEVFGFL